MEKMTDREEFKIQILPADNPSNFFLMKKTEKVCKIKKRLYICIYKTIKKNKNVIYNRILRNNGGV